MADMSDLVALTVEQDVARITLNRPDRHNSLTPDLLIALTQRLGEIRDKPLTAVVLSGAGKSFSSGGDVAAFAAVASDALADYASHVVSLLNDAILKILALPFPVVAKLHGFVTGGSAGLVFASDIVIMADDAHIAPYHSVVGFAPDGGWTALLPSRIGEARAFAIQCLNTSILAGEALQFGLATQVASAERLDEEINRSIAQLREKSSSSIARAKRIIWTDERLAQVALDLDAERIAFVEQISKTEVRDRMAAFLGRRP
ncbi:MAG: enoyl-CoA hydratase/isomerase family protein [Pseudomonadota bacterium]